MSLRKVSRTNYRQLANSIVLIVWVITAIGFGLALVGKAFAQSAPGTQCVASAFANGTPDAITIPALPCALTTNLLILTSGGANTTTTPTLQPLGLPAQTIVRPDLTPLQPGDIGGFGSKALLNPTGNLWVLLNPLKPYGGAGSILTAALPDTIQEFANVSTTSGSPIVHFSGASFSQADVGKLITIFGAGGTYGRLTSSILSVQDSSDITLAVNATNTLASQREQIFYGSDQYTNLQVNTFTPAAEGGVSCQVNNGVYLTSKPLTSLPITTANNFYQPAGLCEFSSGAVVVAMGQMANLMTWGSMSSDYLGILHSSYISGGMFDGNFLADSCEFVPFFIQVTVSNQNRKNCVHQITYGDMLSPSASAGAFEKTNDGLADFDQIGVTNVTNASQAVMTTVAPTGWPVGRVVNLSYIPGFTIPQGQGYASIAAISGTSVTLNLNTSNTSTWGIYTPSASGLAYLTLPDMTITKKVVVVSAGSTTTVLTLDNTYVASPTADMVSGTSYHIADMSWPNASTLAASTGNCLDGIYVITVVDSRTISVQANSSACGTYAGGGHVLYMPTQANYVALATGGTGYGANVSKGFLAWSGTGCSSPPVVAVSTDGSGAVVSALAVVRGGNCSVPIGTATTWTPWQPPLDPIDPTKGLAGGPTSPGVSAGSGASFSFGATGAFQPLLSGLGPAVNSMASGVFNANSTDFEGHGDQTYGVRIGVVNNPSSGGYDSKFQAHFYNYPQNEELLASVYAGGDNSFTDLQTDCPARWAIWLYAGNNHATGSEMDCAGFGINPDVYASYVRLEYGGSVDLGFGKVKGSSGARVLQMVSAPTINFGQFGGIFGYSQWAMQVSNVFYAQPDPATLYSQATWYLYNTYGNAYGAVYGAGGAKYSICDLSAGGIGIGLRSINGSADIDLFDSSCAYTGTAFSFFNGNIYSDLPIVFSAGASGPGTISSAVALGAVNDGVAGAVSVVGATTAYSAITAKVGQIIGSFCMGTGGSPFASTIATASGTTGTFANATAYGSGIYCEWDTNVLVASAGTGVAVGDKFTMSTTGEASPAAPTVLQARTIKAVSASPTGGATGSGGPANATCVVSVVGGTADNGVGALLIATTNGSGVVTALAASMYGGQYTVSPGTTAVALSAGTCTGLTGATATLAFGVSGAAVFTHGAYNSVSWWTPGSPTSAVSTTGSGTGFSAYLNYVIGGTTAVWGADNSAGGAGGKIAAVLAADSGNIPIWFDKGTYLASCPTVPNMWPVAGNQIVRGAGRQQSIIKFLPGCQFGFTQSQGILAFFNANGGGVEDLTIDMNRARPSGSFNPDTLAGIQSVVNIGNTSNNAVTNMTFARSEVINLEGGLTGWNAVNSGTATYTNISFRNADCQEWDTTGVVSHCIEASRGQAGGLFQGLTVDGQDSNGTNDAFAVDLGTISHANIHGWGYGPCMGPGQDPATAASSNVVASDNICHDHSISINDVGDADNNPGFEAACANCILANNDVYNVPGACYRTIGEYVTLSSNQGHNCVTAGLSGVSSLNYNAARAGIVAEASSNGPFDSNGIHVVGNHIWPGAGNTTQLYGYATDYEPGSASCAYMQVNGNNFSGNVIANMLLPDACPVYDSLSAYGYPNPIPGPYTVAGLSGAPAFPGLGTFVTDQLTACPVAGAVLTGGGAVKCQVWYNGSAWVGN